MIDSLKGDVVYWSAFAAIFLVELFYWFCQDYFYECKDIKSELRKRLKGYADLNNAGKKNGSDNAPCTEHDILLGILKKIEMKSGILTTVIIFALAVSMSAVLADGNLNQYDRFVTLLTFALLAPLIFSFQGIYHIDQVDFNRFQKCKRGFDEANLSNDLMIDLLNKERAFRFSRKAAMVSIIMFLSIAVFDVALSPFA